METVRVCVVHGHGGPGPLSAECARRVRRAFRIKADATILCGAGEALVMYSAWERMGGVSQGIWLESLSLDTAQNVQYALLLAGCLGVTEIVVVSSWWHLPRVRMCWSGSEFPVQFRASTGHPRYVPREIAALLRRASERASSDEGSVGRVGPSE